MKTSVLLLTAVTAGTLLLGGSPAARAFTYSLEDGTAENSYAFGSAAGNSGSIWLNQFPITGGNNRVTSIAVAYGSPGGANQNVNGLPMQALLYSDPNGDGSPLDSVLLSSVSGTIQSVGTNTFITYTLPVAVTLSGTDFFVGYYVPGFVASSGTEQFFAAIDTTAPSLSTRSFIIANGDGTEPSLTSPGSNDFAGSNADFGITGNWLVRADAVPEPSTWAMAIGGLGMMALVQRRTRRTA